MAVDICKTQLIYRSNQIFNFTTSLWNINPVPAILIPTPVLQHWANCSCTSLVPRCTCWIWGSINGPIGLLTCSPSMLVNLSQGQWMGSECNVPSTTGNGQAALTVSNSSPSPGQWSHERVYSQSCAAVFGSHFWILSPTIQYICAERSFQTIFRVFCVSVFYGGQFKIKKIIIWYQLIVKLGAGLAESPKQKANEYFFCDVSSTCCIWRESILLKKLEGSVFIHKLILWSILLLCWKLPKMG